MTGSIEVLGQYQTQSRHTLPRSPLDEALASMEGAATRFSLDAISDAQTRASYAANIKRMSAQVRADVAAGRISSQVGVEFCHEMRNKIMVEHRKITSVTGLAKAQQHKKTPLTLPRLFEKYATSKFGKPYETLTNEQKRQIHYEVIESSGRDNAKFTKGSDRLRIMGKVGILVTAAFATYEILNADNKVKETARQGMIIGGGAAGGFLAGLGVSLVCGPGAPFCAIAMVLAGSAAGGIAGSLAADALDDELEEFSKWEVF
ncbi:hypothetical protein ACIGBJ_24580 [Stutzerimonas stutzeri]|jgi:hypothetical protein|uniref:Uncharacterized protein n=1 Tax=Stutzerimonas stutzeri TaxID=316 RepID=A0A0D7E3E2_STUST|nr:hypothetical protein [Stutzerimonas stutzeri]KIZ34122.1 hypothetical protein LO50_18390 [Stutzerimonas stutzeri]HCG37459.1 hypothetical protein [Pseudomonas sp.]